MGRRYFVTGGAGFIGSNFVRRVLSNDPDARVTNLDALTYAGVVSTVDELNEFDGHTFVHGDIRDTTLLRDLLPGHDVVVHFAAESHVDRSISGPEPFLSSNVVGTGTLVEAAMRADVARFVHVSTDEVYGSLDEGFAKEDDALNPSSPYAASKAGSDLVALAYHVTHGYNVSVTRCTNNYGPYQYPEKVIPLFTTNLLDGQPVPLYGDGMNERDWLYVEDHCAAVELIADKGAAGQVYNIGANEQLSNIDLTQALLTATGSTDAMINYVPDRLGHDFRYAVNSEKIRSMGWRPEHDFAERLADTVAWYRDRRDWWQPLRGAS